ncbi:hypothetical protein [Psychrobacter celer]|uniref:hypothetical protein n=1 Tax=Psychrobacter celer TaxID=306572 RepID=UPI003FD69A5C
MNCQRLAVWMLLLSSSYLLLGLGLKYHAQSQAKQTLKAANIHTTRIKTMPVLPTILMWRTVAEDNEHRLIELRGSVLDSRLPEYRYLTQYDNAQTLRANLLAQSRPYAQRLDWFSGDWTGYRVQMLPAASTHGDATEQLVVDDLRMMAGDTAFFSFVLAEKANQHAQWQAITPIYAPVIAVDNEPTPSRFELIQQGFTRVFDESMVDGDSGWKLVR